MKQKKLIEKIRVYLALIIATTIVMPTVVFAAKKSKQPVQQKPQPTVSRNKFARTC